MAAAASAKFWIGTVSVRPITNPTPIAINADAPAAGEDGDEAKSESSRPAKPRGKFKHGKFVPPAAPKDGWNYQLPEFTPPELEAQRVNVSGIDAKNIVKQFHVNRSGKIGVTTSHWPREQTQINVMDFQSGEVIAAISVAGAMVRFDEERRETYISAALRAAGEISSKLAIHGSDAGLAPRALTSIA